MPQKPHCAKCRTELQSGRCPSYSCANRSSGTLPSTQIVHLFVSEPWTPSPPPPPSFGNDYSSGSSGGGYDPGPGVDGSGGW